jgi:hypothetical protein
MNNVTSFCSDSYRDSLDDSSELEERGLAIHAILVCHECGGHR